MTEKLTQAIIVLHPFRSYQKGDIVFNAETITDIRTYVSPSNFAVTSIPDSAAPAEKTP